MKLRCINTGSNKAISRTTEYDVVEDLGDKYAIINDNDVQKNYSKKLFEVVPEIPPVITIEELNITTSITNDNQAMGFTVNCPLVQGNTFNYNSGNLMTYATTSISCGIHQIFNLDGLLGHLVQLRAQFERNLTQNTTTFVLSEDIDLNETFKNIYTSLLQDLIANFQGGDRRCGILLLSTTTNSINTNEDFRDVLNEIAENTVITTNPNSRNEIQMWTLLTQA